MKFAKFIHVKKKIILKANKKNKNYNEKPIKIEPGVNIKI